MNREQGGFFGESPIFCDLSNFGGKPVYKEYSIGYNRNILSKNAFWGSAAAAKTDSGGSFVGAKK